MEKKYNFQEDKGEVDKVNESEIPYQNRLQQSIQQAKEGKTIKVTTDEELKKLLDSL